MLLLYCIGKSSTILVDFFHFVVDYHFFLLGGHIDFFFFFLDPGLKNGGFGWLEGMARVSRSGSAAAPPGPPMGSLGAKRTTI